MFGVLIHRRKTSSPDEQRPRFPTTWDVVNSENESVLEYASEELKGNSEIVLAVVSNNGGV